MKPTICGNDHAQSSGGHIRSCCLLLTSWPYQENLRHCLIFRRFVWLHVFPLVLFGKPPGCGKWRVGWELTVVKWWKKRHACFSIPVLHDRKADLHLKWELYKYYCEISSLQSTLPSPVGFKQDQMCSYSCQMWSEPDRFLVDRLCSLCVASQPSVKPRVLLSDGAGEIHKCYRKVTICFRAVSTFVKLLFFVLLRLYLFLIAVIDGMHVYFLLSFSVWHLVQVADWNPLTTPPPPTPPLRWQQKTQKSLVTVTVFMSYDSGAHS